MKTKTFDVSDVLSISSSRLVSTRGCDALYDVLNWMTSDNLYTHQLPRAMEECQPWLLKWFPELAKANISENLAKLDTLIEGVKPGEKGEECVAMWVSWMIIECGLKKTYDIGKIPNHIMKNPIEEASEMMGGPEKVIAVVINK